MSRGNIGGVRDSFPQEAELSLSNWRADIRSTFRSRLWRCMPELKRRRQEDHKFKKEQGEEGEEQREKRRGKQRKGEERRRKEREGRGEEKRKIGGRGERRRGEREPARENRKGDGRQMEREVKKMKIAGNKGQLLGTERGER